MATQSLPLDGITVVTLEHAIAAPFCTRQLADQGARVIKIERPGVGDFARAYDTRVNGLCSHFVWTNRSKESLSLDLKADAAKDEPTVRAQIALLHARVLGELVLADSPEVDQSFALWSAVAGVNRQKWKILLTAMFQDHRLTFF